MTPDENIGGSVSVLRFEKVDEGWVDVLTTLSPGETTKPSMSVEEALDVLAAAFPSAQISVTKEVEYYGATDKRRQWEWCVWVGELKDQRLFDGPSLEVCVAQALARKKQ